MDKTFAYLITSLLLLVIWVIFYYLRPESRRKMFYLSLLTAPLGLTEPLFVPSYWLPFTLFDLARKTGFDFESLLFSFAVGGIATVLYETFLRTKRKKVGSQEQFQRKHRFHRLALLSPFLSFAIAYFFMPINPIYSAILAMSVGALACWLCRPDLLKSMIIGSLLFFAIYFIVFLIGFVWVFPGYVKEVWNLPAISGILVVGVPIEELLFAASLGSMWSSVYEHFSWYRFIES